MSELDTEDKKNRSRRLQKWLLPAVASFCFLRPILHLWPHPLGETEGGHTSGELSLVARADAPLMAQRSATFPAFHLIKKEVVG